MAWRVTAPNQGPWSSVGHGKCSAMVASCCASKVSEGQAGAPCRDLPSRLWAAASALQSPWAWGLEPGPPPQAPYLDLGWQASPWLRSGCVSQDPSAPEPESWGSFHTTLCQHAIPQSSSVCSAVECASLCLPSGSSGLGPRASTWPPLPSEACSLRAGELTTRWSSKCGSLLRE